MNKFLTKIAAAFVGIALAIGVGVTVGHSDVKAAKAATATVAYSGDTTTNMTGNNDAATLGLSATDWSVVGAKGSSNNFPGLNKSHYIALYYNASGSNTLTVSSLQSYTISSIVINYTGSGYANGKVTVGGNDVADSDNSDTSSTHAISSTSFVVTNGNTSNTQVRISSIAITYTTGGQTVAVTGVALNKSSTSIAVGETETLTATISPAGATDQVVSWTSSNEEAATVANGVITPVDYGSTTITVTTHDGSFTDTCDVSITLPSYTDKTVAEARTIINALGNNVTTSDYYRVTGYVTNITTPYDSNHGNISFTIADTVGGTDTLTCYRVKCSAETAADILAGAQVRLLGKFEKFVNNQSVVTHELVDSLKSQLEILSAGVAPVTYDVTIAEAIAVIEGLSDNEQTYDKYTVQGVVNSITHAYDNTKMSFTIGATLNASDTITIYNLALSAEDAATVLVGATIEVTGNIKKYSSACEIVNGEDFDLITPAPTYSVTYSALDADGGTVPTDATAYTSGASVTVLGNTGDLTKSGYTFAGWSDGNTTYQAGGTFSITANTTLTAQWQIDQSSQPSNPPYSATFTSVETHSYTQNKEFTLSEKDWIASVSQVNGGVFYLGCNSSNSSKGVLNDNSTFADVVTALASEDATYNSNKATAHAYALLFNHAYNGVKTISFDWDGGNNAFQVYLFGDSGSGYFLLGSTDYATSGASVAGSVLWTNPSGTTNFTKIAIVARPGASDSTATNKTLRASSFEISATAPAATYTVTYDANGGSGDTMANTVGTAPVIAACTYTAPEGKIFSRWNTAADGSGDNYDPADIAESDLDLFAIWVTEVGSNVTMTPGDNSGNAKVVTTTKTKDAVKCGTGSNAGVMTMTLKTTGITKIKAYIAGWSSDTTNKTVSVSISSGTISPTSIEFTNDSGISGSSTTFTLGGTETTYKFEFTIMNAPANAVITLTADNAANNRFVVWGATDLFAEKFASDFTSYLTCNSNGTSQPTYTNDYSWSEFEALYSSLDDEEQGRLKGADANQSGNAIEQAMAKYDYIVGKYNKAQGLTSAYNDFINRNPAPVGSSSMTLNIISNDANTTSIIIVVISMISLTAIGGFFFIKKRKNNN